MTIASVIQQLFTQVQFLGLFGSLDVPMPGTIGTMMEYINLANLDIRLLVGQQKIPAITFRRVFIGVSIVIPLLIALALALLFQPTYVVLWFATLLLGGVFLSAGMLGYFLPSTSVDAASPMTFIFAGSVIVGSALLGATVFWCASRIMNYRGVESSLVAGERAAETWRYYEAFHRQRTLGHMVVFVFFLVLGLLFMQAAKVTVSDTGTHEWFDSQVWFFIGAAMCALAALSFLYAIVNMVHRGRVLVIRLTWFLSYHILLLTVVAISASYSPVIDYASNVFLCTNYDCPNGTVFNPYAKRPLNSFDTSTSRFCDACDFNTTEQPHCAAFTCDGIRSYRSWKYPESPCDDEAVYYFYVAAAAALVCYAIAIPLLYFVVVRRNTEGVMSAKVVPGGPEESNDQVWVRKMTAVKPFASSLYDTYRFPRQHFHILTLVYRLVVTLVVNIVAAMTSFAVVIVMTGHATAFVITCLHVPFINRFEQALALVLALCNTLDGGFAVYLWQSENADVPAAVVIAIVAVNIALPLGVGVVAAGAEIYSRRMNKLNSKATEEHFDATIGTFNDPINGADTGDLERFVSTHSPPRLRSKREGYFSRRTSAALAVTTDDKKERRNFNRIVTIELDEFSRTRLSCTFISLGVLFVFVLGLCILGTLREKRLEFLVGSDPLYRTVDTTLAGYQTWSEFTESCCCLTQQTPNLGFNMTERWVCENGRTVEHGRVSTNLVDSGLFLRGMCMTTHRSGCGMVTSSDVARLVCIDAPEIIPRNVTSVAYALLW